MPGLRAARAVRPTDHPTAHATSLAKPAKKKGIVGKSGKPNCGSGHGGFKPGNTCGKGKRQALAERIRTARKAALSGDGDIGTLRQHVREIKAHRRAHEGAVSNERAKAIHAGLRAGKAPEKPEFSGHPTVHSRNEKISSFEFETRHAGHQMKSVDTPPIPKKIPKEPKPKAEPKPKKGYEATPHPDNLTHHTTLGGSTGATLQTDSDGNKYVVKKGNNADHIREESHADKLYEALGIPVAQHTLHETASGPVKVSRHIDGARELGDLKYSDPTAHAKAIEDIKKHFVADALLGNWDVAGMKHDNILVDSKGVAHRIDNGGSLRFRAQGAKKADHQFGEEVGEIDSMRHGYNNPGATSVFGSVTDKEISSQIKDILKKKDAVLAAAPADLRPILEKRIGWLANKRLEIESKNKNESIAAKAAEKLKAKQDKKAAAIQKKIDDHQAKNPGKPLPKSLAGAQAKAEHEFDNWSKPHAKYPDTYDSDHLETGDKQLKAAFKPWAQSLPASEKQAIKDFSGSEYMQMNMYLWGVTKYPDASTVHKANLVEKAVVKGSLPKPTVVYRGISKDAMKAIGIENPDLLMPGQIIHMTGIKSTSINAQKAKSFAGQGVVFKILADAGTKGAYINGNGISSFNSEKEFTLPHSTQKFKIHAVKQTGAPHSYEPSHEITLSIADG